MYTTQSSSAPRLKNDTLGNDTLKELYDAFGSKEIEAFRRLCIETVQAGGGKQPRKDEIIAAINATDKKQTMLKKAQDFILAGMGLGV